MTSTNGLTKSRTRYHLTITPLHKGVFYFLYRLCLIYTLKLYFLFPTNNVIYINKGKDL